MGVRSLNNPLQEFLDTFLRSVDASSPVPPGTGLTATGGVISDYTDPGSGAIYRSHIFTSSGTFDVTELGTFGDTVDYLVVAGGGSGGGGGGGGAGGFVTNISGYPASRSSYSIPAFPSSYTIEIGGGGARTGAASGPDGPAPGNWSGNAGSNTNFYPTPVSYPNPTYIRATGGGGGGGYGSPNVGGSGASGGGGGPAAGAAGAASPNTDPDRQGYPGSAAAPNFATGGGGGAGGSGVTSTPTQSGDGGVGYPSGITGITTHYAGGGGGGAQGSGITAGDGGLGGGGGGGAYNAANWGLGGAPGGQPGSPNFSRSSSPPFTAPGSPYEMATGGDGGVSTGGGGGGMGVSVDFGGSGGSGIVVVRYQIAQLTATAKATGGSISYYDGKTIHTFTSSGTFATAPNWTSATVEYVVVAGGGAGGGNIQGGGGGAGAYRTGTTPIGAHPVSTTIQIGGGANSTPNPATSGTGTPSYFGTPITSSGGGSGGNYPGLAAVAGGSGGGGWGAGPGGAPNAGATGTGDPFPGTIGATPVNGWGNDGGQGGTYAAPAYGPAGGGGAGAAGSNGSPSDTTAGRGGAGIQLPATFRNPLSTVGAPGPTSAPTPNGFDTSGKYWVAGGGGGTGYNPPGTAIGVNGAPGGAAPGSSSPYAGGGGGAGDNNGLGLSLGSPGTINTGGGGGGGERDSNPSGGNGGSGIVLIAYP